MWCFASIPSDIHHEHYQYLWVELDRQAYIRILVVRETFDDIDNWIDKLSDSTTDTIGSLLDLANSQGRRMALLSVAAVKGIFDQQHMETFLLATLPNVLQTAISTNPVKAILNTILKISVPIINRAAKKA